ncbi:TPA: capsid cement protein [Neisseria lactamica]|uniref:capsid cement protein n=1 Tax=Neisseria lactamica TaxID=486 RepID=UPI00031E0655|nr:capsid cement protein [Neisseria lactamica]
MAQTKQVVLVTTVKTTGKVVKNRFVDFAGKQAAAGVKVLGTATFDADAGDTLAVDALGIALVEAGGTVAVGDEVAADAQGAAVKAVGNAKIAGTARSAATAAGEIVQVFLKG